MLSSLYHRILWYIVVFECVPFLALLIGLLPRFYVSHRGKRSCHSVIVIEEYISWGGSALTTFCCTVFSRTRTEREGKTRPRKRVERDLSCSQIGHGMYNAIIFYCPFLRPHQTLIWHLHQHYTFFRLPWTVWGSQTVFLENSHNLYSYLSSPTEIWSECIYYSCKGQVYMYS
jgi:hypothetical protein